MDFFLWFELHEWIIILNDGSQDLVGKRDTLKPGTQLIAAPVTLPVLALLVSVKCACGQLRALFSFLYAPGTRDDASKTASDGNLSVVLSPKAEHRYMHA